MGDQRGDPETGQKRRRMFYGKKLVDKTDPAHRLSRCRCRGARSHPNHPSLASFLVHYPPSTLPRLSPRCQKRWALPLTSSSGARVATRSNSARGLKFSDFCWGGLAPRWSLPKRLSLPAHRRPWPARIAARIAARGRPRLPFCSNSGQAERRGARPRNSQHRR